MGIPAWGVLHKSFPCYLGDILKLGCNLTDKNHIFPMLESTGCPRKRVPKLNGYNIFNILGRSMKQKLAES